MTLRKLSKSLFINFFKLIKGLEKVSPFNGKEESMRTMVIIMSLLVGLFSFNAQASFFEDLGKDLSMLSCKNATKKKLIESVILNKDPSKPQIWSWKIAKNGDLVENPNPRQWYTIYKKEDLKYFCWEARLSRYVRQQKLQMYPAVRTTYVCGQKVYSCMVQNESDDSDDRTPPTDSDNEGSTIDDDSTDDGGTGPGDTDDAGAGPGDSDDNF